MISHINKHINKSRLIYDQSTGPEYVNPDDREGCWCKSDLEMANQKVVNGVYSGETVCEGNNIKCWYSPFQYFPI